MPKQAVRKRIGGRGCPGCGSHDTENVSRDGMTWCNTCQHRWVPCVPGCRGYGLDLESTPPEIRGCVKCGVPDAIARCWPEAWRLMALRLDGRKLDPVNRG